MLSTYLMKIPETPLKITDKDYSAEMMRALYYYTVAISKWRVPTYTEKCTRTLIKRFSFISYGYFVKNKGILNTFIVLFRKSN